MHTLKEFCRLIVVLLFALVLLPSFGRASTANCPSEPASNVPIGDGEVFSGTNCNLYTDGDVDSYTFTGTSGNTYQLAAALNGAFAANICLTLYGPNDAQIFPTGAPAPGNGCTYVGYQGDVSSVVTDQELPATGTYTVVITQIAGSSGTQNYAVSRERLYPFPPNAQAVPKLGQAVTGDITPLTDSNAFTFGPIATTGTYEVTATLPSNASDNICLTLYDPSGAQIFPTGTLAPGNGCTYIGYQGDAHFVTTQFTPSLRGKYLAFLQELGNDGTVSSYSLEVSCVVGNCPPFTPPTPPPCTLADTASYNATTSTLTMNFTVGNNETSAVTWNAWLSYQDTIESLFSVSRPVTNPPKTITKTKTDLPMEGKVGVLSTLITATGGIVCSSYVQTNTGTP